MKRLSTHAVDPSGGQGCALAPPRGWLTRWFALVLSTLILLVPATVPADDWEMDHKIKDPSKENPPEDLLWRCTYYYYDAANNLTWGECGEDLPVGPTLTFGIPVRPDYFKWSGGYTLKDDGTFDRSDYFGHWKKIYPETPNAFSTWSVAKWGNLWGYVRMPAGTPLPRVIVAAYDEDKRLVATAVTDANGRYEFRKEEATDLEEANHWVLPLRQESRVGVQFVFGLFYLTASAVDAHSPAELDGYNWTRTAVAYPSQLRRKDITVGSMEDPEDPSEHDDQCEEEQPEKKEGDTCPGAEAPSGGGEPIHFTTGSVYLSQEEAALPGIRRTVTLRRRYNSRRAYFGKVGGFGRGWSHSYEKSITNVLPRLIRLNKGDAAPVYFQDQDEDGIYLAELPTSEGSRIEQTANGWVRHFPQGGSETYDDSGLLVAQTDRIGNTTSLGRDAAGRLRSITAPGGRAFRFSYDGDRIGEVSGPEGLIARYSYTGDQLTRVNYPDGSADVFEYDGEGQLLSRQDEGGRVIEAHTYEGGRALTSEIEGGDERLTFFYERPLGGKHQTAVTDALGSTTTYTIGERGSSGLRGVTAMDGPTDGNWLYDNQGRLSSAYLGGRHIRLERDSSGAIVAQRLQTADGPIEYATTTYTRDSLGRTLAQTSPDGATRTWTYGTAGPLTITDPLDQTTTIAYGPLGLVRLIKDPADNTTYFDYNAFGDLTSVTDPMGNTYEIERDGMGRATRVIDPAGYATAATYDSSGRLVALSPPGELRVEMRRDLGGRITQVTRPGGGVTRFAYDAGGLLRVVRDGPAAILSLDYDAMSRLARIVDPLGQATRFGRTSDGRLETTTYPAGGQDTLVYDSAGRLARRVDRRGLVTSYDYDGAGRLRKHSSSDGTINTQYVYDQSGRPVMATSTVDTLEWRYYDNGLLLSETSARHGTTLSYDYYSTGLPKSMSLNGQIIVNYYPDHAGRLERLRSADREFVFGYDKAGRRILLDMPHGVQTEYKYDDALRLNEVVATLGGVTINAASYLHDGASNRTSATVNGREETLTYDAQDRMVGVSNADEGLSTYEYDLAGNRTSAVQGDHVIAYNYGPGHRLVSRGPGAALKLRGSTDEAASVLVNGQTARLLPGGAFEAEVPVVGGTNSVTVQATDASGNSRTNQYEFELSGGSATYAYDASGNLIRRIEDGHTWAYEWNAEDQLTRVLRDGEEIETFAYDPLGRRVQKTVNGRIHSYIYDGMDVLEERITGGTTSTTYRYIHGPGVDEPLARVDVSTGTVLYYHSDALGSITRVTDDSGSVVEEYRYDAWGRPQSGAEPDGYSFTSREWEPEIGLYYYRARYYDPELGRFISEDPVSSLGGYSNPYTYAWNNPGTLVDPFGLAGGSVNLGQGFTARPDYFNAGGSASFEYHVFNPAGKEIGVAGPKGWINKHGFKGPPALPEAVANRLNGKIVEELRRRAMIPPKGRANIKSLLKNLTRPDKANVVAILYCFVFPETCAEFEKAVECLLNPSSPECYCGA